jgi:hypothetical protein
MFTDFTTLTTEAGAKDHRRFITQDYTPWIIEGLNHPENRARYKGGFNSAH